MGYTVNEIESDMVPTPNIDLLNERDSFFFQEYLLITLSLTSCYVTTCLNQIAYIFNIQTFNSTCGTYYVTLIIPQLHSDRVKILMFSFLEFSDYFYYTECVTIFGRVYRSRVMSWVLYGLLYGDVHLKLHVFALRYKWISIEKQPSNVFTKNKVWRLVK